ncbi:DUF5134 domain-containing protein [Pseudonocardia acaciae]|uniref:DUF5134 domain-containing protein n=1 Tax=Pseudonocardia acaciae TaxID=551276 RepID=UPI000568601E|nr:DUF5134 domain-containing protein [Pseudonocardia acaciae]
MPGWLGMTLAAAFALVAGHRGVRRDLPGMLMALGMAIMSLAMAENAAWAVPAGYAGPAVGAELGPLTPHGPWWAGAFAALALWPLVSRARAGRVCGGPASHLVGGLAMIYMCALAPMPHGPDPVQAVTVGSGHGGHHGSTVAIGVVPASPADTPLNGALALVGWALACYFLLATVSTLTRRGGDGTLALPRPAVLGEAVMALGTVIMLVAMT